MPEATTEELFTKAAFDFAYEGASIGDMVKIIRLQKREARAALRGEETASAPTDEDKATSEGNE